MSVASSLCVAAPVACIISVSKLTLEVCREAKEGIESMSLRVKFDLLHDEAPEVASIKAYMQGIEAALGQNSEKMGEYVCVDG